MQREVDRFLASPALAESTRRAYGVDVREFARWLEHRGTRLEDVDVRVLADYAAELGRARPRKLAPATIGRKLAAVRAFLRHGLGAERVPDASFAPRRLYDEQGRGDEYRALVERFKSERAEFLRGFPSLSDEIVAAVS